MSLSLHPQDHRNEASRAFHQGDLQGAILALKRAVALNPFDVDSWLKMAHVFGALEQFGEASEAMLQASNARPDDRGLALRTGMLCASVDRLEYAHEALERAHTLASLERDDLSLYASVHARTHSLEEALDLYQPLLQEEPGELRDHAALSSAQLLLILDRKELAREHLEELASSPHTEIAHLSRRLLSRLLLDQSAVDDVASILENIERNQRSLWDAFRLTQARWSQLHDNQPATPLPKAQTPVDALPWSLQTFSKRWTAFGVPEDLALACARVTLLWIHHVLRLRPWTLQRRTAAALTDQLMRWMTGGEDTYSATSVMRVCARVLAAPIQWPRGAFSNALQRLVSTARLDAVSVDILILTVTPHIVPALRSWLHDLDLYNVAYEEDLLVSLADPTQHDPQKTRALLDPNAPLQAFALLHIRPILDAHDDTRRAFAPSPYVIDLLSGVRNRPWRSLHPGARSAMTALSSGSEDEPLWFQPLHAQLRGVSTSWGLVLEGPPKELLDELRWFDRLLGSVVALPANPLLHTPTAQLAGDLRVRTAFTRAQPIILLDEGPESDAQDAQAIHLLRAMRQQRASLPIFWTSDPGRANRLARRLDIPSISLPATHRASVADVLEHRLGGMARVLLCDQTWDDIVLSEDTLTNLRHFVKLQGLRDDVMDRLAESRRTESGFAALLHGSSGTGKTLAARVLSAELGLPLVEIDVSRVISRFVGEAEKNLTKIFDAVGTDGLLVFDNADSLFARRTKAKRSSDRYANMLVNFLLQKLESYPGTTLLVTHNMRRLDKALLRRLTFKIEFEDPDEDIRLRLWEFITQGLDLGDAELDGFAEIFPMNGAQIVEAVHMASIRRRSEGAGLDHDALYDACQSLMRQEGFLIKD